MTRPSLFTEGPARDPSFLLCRDEEMYRGHREFIEELWIRYEPYCPDTHFEKQIREQFHQRAWEAYLACLLLDGGHELRKTSSEGPDLCIESEIPVWIEAIAVEPGNSEDRVKTQKERRDTSISQIEDEDVWIGELPSEESLILRCTSAMALKSRKFKNYKSKGIVGCDDICLVAISLGKLEGASMYFSTRPESIFLKAFFGIGEEYVAYTPHSGSGIRHGHHHRPTVSKASGNTVSACQFLSDDATHVSGLLGTCVDIFNASGNPSEILLVNNPKALSPLSPRMVNIGTEFRAEEGHLKRLDAL
jgi:hypothetical protein